MSKSKIATVACLLLLGCIHTTACCKDEVPQGTLIEITSKEELVMLMSAHNWSNNSIFLLIPHASNVSEQEIVVNANYSALLSKPKPIPKRECTILPKGASIETRSHEELTPFSNTHELSISLLNLLLVPGANRKE